MSDIANNTADAGEPGAEEETLFRERVADNPRPALLWLAGLAVFVLLEFSTFMGGIKRLGHMLSFVVSGVATIPGWIGGNVGSGIANAFSVLGLGSTGDALGEIAGHLASDLISLAILFVASIFLTGILLPWRVAERFELDVTRRMSVLLDRLVVTGMLGAVAFVLVFTPIGTIVSNEISFISSVLDSLSSLPSLTDRDVISNDGHRTPDGGWDGTFLGLSPAWAWGIRVIVVYAYAFALIAWMWKGYNVFRTHYRAAEWTPRDDTIRRFRNHYWGLFGLIVVTMFLILALWAPAVSPVTAEANIYSTYEHEFEYLDEDTGEINTIAHGTANVNSQSGNVDKVGLWSYDDYDRWSPLGTTHVGQNMMTHLAYGAQTSLVIGLIAVGLGGLIAVLLSLITAYYKGIADVLTVIASDTIISIPAFLLVMMLSVIFQEGNHFLAEPMDGGLLLALIFAFVYWPGLWRSIRGPSLQVAEEEWVDAAKSYGQTPLATMRKHMAPYIAGYIMIYASLILGGVIIATAALSFLGLGINEPTPEWGRLINSGRQYVSTQSWHISTVSGIMIVIVVTGFNALGDGVRDAIDPEADVPSEGAGAAGGGG
ncbi:ABC transporter permease [Halovivax gelatinilyticus]|uniref:ABC transporter permease n=1 Tax=Halovivax gelatinilyticus TaxID=2961597 RepID=UPI0020CA6D83|nr:ABC transporter permease [Halovivax gelatinilyticus]